MSSYGVLSTGFLRKDVDTIKAELEADFKAIFGDGLNVLPTSDFGQLISSITDRESDIWALAEAVYGSQYPGASGQSLDHVLSLTGVVRLAAVETEGAIICTGLAATVLTVDRVVSSGAGIRIDSTAEATLALATAWGNGVVYALGDLRSSDGNIYVCVLAGTSGVTAPTGTGDGISDDVCLWNFVGDGLSFASVNFKAEDTGALAVAAGAVHTDAGTGAIETPVSGWEDARNIADLTTGRAVEKDPAARTRRAGLLTASGSATVDAIATYIADSVSGVTHVSGFENRGDVVDGDGLPPHSIEMVVLGGTDQDIWDAIWASKAGGIETHGTETGTSEDRNGDAQAVNFNKPTSKDIHVIIDVTTDGDWPSDGKAQVRAALVAWGILLGVGTTVYQSKMYGVVTKEAGEQSGVSGIVNITKLWMAIGGAPGGEVASLAIAAREISTWSTTDIDVNVT